MNSLFVKHLEINVWEIGRRCYIVCYQVASKKR